MIETQAPKATERLSLWKRFIGLPAQVVENPVVRKELRGRMRGRRAFVVLTVYLLLLSCLTSLVYYAYAAASQEPYGPDGNLIGKSFTPRSVNTRNSSRSAAALLVSI